MTKRSTYSEKLKDPRWQKLRLEVLERDGWACRNCGDKTETLHVHHTFYEFGKDPWDYDSASLWTLCEACHEEAEFLKVWFKRWIPAEPLELQSYLHEFLAFGLDFTFGDKIQALSLILAMIKAMHIGNDTATLAAFEKLRTMVLK